ncbi:hypothetical protein HBB16_05580 [Pseudonocardia sp. MCCB 268]|nr:hypothetical protein [Pseudonocardia cytotoxica]
MTITCRRDPVGRAAAQRVSTGEVRSSPASRRTSARPGGPRARPARLGTPTSPQELPGGDRPGVHRRRLRQRGRRLAAPRTASPLRSTSPGPCFDIRPAGGRRCRRPGRPSASRALAGSSGAGVRLLGPAVSWAPRIPAARRPARPDGRTAEPGLRPVPPAFRVELSTYATGSELPTLATAVQEMLRPPARGDHPGRRLRRLARPTCWPAGTTCTWRPGSYPLDVLTPAPRWGLDYTCRGSYNINRTARRSSTRCSRR